MKTVIAGCGKIGRSIVESLVNEDNDIVVIDGNPGIVSEITDVYDVMGVCGNCADCDILNEAGIYKTDLFIATTGSDEQNMLSCFIARKMGAKHTVARIRNPEYNDSSLGFLCQQLDLSLSINPDLMVAQEIFDILKLPSAAKVETFGRRNFELIELRLKQDSILDGMTLLEMREKYKAKFLVCCVQRDDEVFIPYGNFALKSGDRISLTASPSEMQRLLKGLGLMQKQAKSLLIIGGSRTTRYLSSLLTASGTEVKIIDKDPAVCKTLSDALEDAVVINGDGAKQDLLTEEGISSYDAFAALSGNDEENILLSFYALGQNVPKVITKINRDEFASTADRLGLDCIVSPLRTTTNVIVRYARALQNSLGSKIESLYKLMDGKAELIEFNVAEDSALVNIPLKQLKIKPNILIVGLVRTRKTFIPTGDDCIKNGDKVILIAANQRLRDLTDILR